MRRYRASKKQKLDHNKENIKDSTAKVSSSSSSSAQAHAVQPANVFNFYNCPNPGNN
jgi:hypothetical protein